MRECGDGSVTLASQCPDAVGSFLDFAYSGEILITDGNVDILFQLASFLQVTLQSLVAPPHVFRLMAIHSSVCLVTGCAPVLDVQFAHFCIAFLFKLTFMFFGINTPGSQLWLSLQVPVLSRACSDFLVGTMDLSNCLTLLSMAEAYGSASLLHSASEFVVENFSDLSQTQEFLEMQVIMVLGAACMQNQQSFKTFLNLQNC